MNVFILASQHIVFFLLAEGEEEDFAVRDEMFVDKFFCFSGQRAHLLIFRLALVPSCQGPAILFKVGLYFVLHLFFYFAFLDGCLAIVESAVEFG